MENLVYDTWFVDNWFILLFYYMDNLYRYANNCYAYLFFLCP